MTVRNVKNEIWSEETFDLNEWKWNFNIWWWIKGV